MTPQKARLLTLDEINDRLSTIQPLNELSASVVNREVVRILATALAAMRVVEAAKLEQCSYLKEKTMCCICGLCVTLKPFQQTGEGKDA